MASLPDQKATPETLYYCGSTTKSFTAAAVLKLSERSKDSKDPLTLRTKIQSLIREDFVLQDDYATKHVTLEDALSHRTGMPCHDDSVGGTVDGKNDDLSNNARRMRHLPLTAELREKWQYSNIMYNVVSYVVETISSCWLGDFFRNNFWQPLGMNSTFLSRADANRAEGEGGARLATGYWWDEPSKKHIEATYMGDSPLLGGAGNVISNVLDYAKYLRAMITKDDKFLSADSFRELRQLRIVVPHDPKGPPKGLTGPEMYGLGWFSAVYREHEVFSHSGGVNAFSVEMAYIPTLSNGVGITLMGNSECTSNYAGSVLLYRIMDDILGIPEGERFDWFECYDQMWEQARERRDPVAAKKKIYADAPDAKDALPTTLPLEEYAGEYWHDGYRDLTVKFTDAAESSSEDGKSSKMLQIDVPKDRVWVYSIHFEHISGNYFLAHQNCPKRVSESFLNNFLAAEFRIGVDGRVAEMGIAFDDALNGEKIWFKKVK